MPAVTRRPYRRREESVAIVREILSAGELTVGQICEVAHANRVTVLEWLRVGERDGIIVRRSPPRGCVPSIWALAVIAPIVEPPPEGPRPFEDLCRALEPRRWYTRREIGRFRDLLDGAVQVELLETCRRWYINRRGAPATLYKLTVAGELRGGWDPHRWGFAMSAERPVDRYPELEEDDARNG